MVLRALQDVDRDRVLAPAELPDVIRGYEGVKLANVARYRERQAEILTRAGN